MHAFSQVHFLRAAGRAAELPPAGPPEIAFAGRSNVGKSSAINALCGRRALARTSKTPGRTQTINFFELAGGARLVDLPGYGYARVSRDLRARWGELIESYLEKRATVAGVVVIMDVRHAPTPADLQLLEWLRGRRVLVLLSKADKLSKTQQRAALEHTTRALARRAGETALTLFSSVSRQGVEEARERMSAWLAVASPAQK